MLRRTVLIEVALFTTAVLFFLASRSRPERRELFLAAGILFLAAGLWRRLHKPGSPGS